MNPCWTVTPEKAQLAIQRIVEVSRPKKVILFGSYARQTLHIHSDLDILIVVDDEVKDTREESIRIRRQLRGILMPMDIVVVSERQFRKLAKVPGLIYAEALQQGTLVYEAA